MMDDFKPKKPASAARISRLPKASTPDPDVDQEVSDAFVEPDVVAAADDAATPVIGTKTSPAANAKAAVSAKTQVTEPQVDETVELDANDEASTPDEAKGKKDFALPPGVKPTKPKWEWWPPKAWVKKQWLIVGGSAVLLIALILLLVLVVFHKKPVVKQTAAAKKSAPKVVKPTTVASRLTGVEVTPEQAKLPVTGIMIENSTDARPQSGLDQAGVVYEAVAEGGITRFLALFEENQPDFVGPVRSSRPYYLRWLLPFDAAYAHVGGSPDALSDIKKLGVKDLDQFYNSGPYTRINSREAPHNVYTSLAGLINLEKTKGYETSTFDGFPRTKKEAPSNTPNATSIDFTISGPAFSVHYDYSKLTNSYKRSEGGAPHMVVDKNGQTTQLQPKVVVALVIPQSSGAADAQGANYTTYDTIGTGPLYVFQDGIVTVGSWSKSSDKAQFVFTDDTDKPLPLNAGQTWISVVGLSGDVSYK